MSDFVGSDTYFWVLLSIVVLLAALIAWTVRRRLTRQLTYRLNQIAHEFRSDLLVPDGNGNDIHLDYLLLGTRRIWVILFRPDQGTVFASEAMSEWTVMAPTGRYTFANPLPALYDRIAAVRRLVPGIEVQGYALFPQGAEFSKGQPDQVRLPDELIEEMRQDKAAQERPADELKSAWDNLLEATRPA